jgi:tRNA threonylcarbamoyladenosine biosynthesis protein TsaB
MAQPRTVLILALDTTTRGGSIAVVNEHELLALVPGDEARTHGERLPGELALALDRAGVAKTAVDLFAVATGPGAFTGLRIGLAAIQGLAMTLDRPVAGVSALDALVEEAGQPAVDFIAPWMDAQRGDVFASLVEAAPGSRRTIIEPIAANPRALLEQWRAQLHGRATLFTGDAVARDSAIIAGAGEPQWSIRRPGPLAPAVAALGLMRARAGLAGPPHALTPIYVRRPDAEIERERRSGA